MLITVNNCLKLFINVTKCMILDTFFLFVILHNSFKQFKKFEIGIFQEILIINKLLLLLLLLINNYLIV